MPEGINAEVAQRLNEKSIEERHSPSHESGEERSSRSREIVEIAEALVLAFVTVATAWSGYQAARWDGHNALHYGQASKQRTQANKLATLGGQERLYDITTFNSWLEAKTIGNTRLSALYKHRFTAEYKVAFDAWLKTNPFHNPNAPPDPVLMPQYHNAQLERSDALEAQSSVTFEQGTTARETADEYVRDTLFLASILFLVALGQRFKVQNVRRGLLGAAFILLLVALYALTTLPIA